MSRRPLVTMGLVSLCGVGAWPLDAFAYQCAEAASAAIGDVTLLRAYIDPGVAGFVIVTVLGFVSSIGYWARSHIGRAKRWLFGPGETTTDVGADDEFCAEDNDDGEGENC